MNTELEELAVKIQKLFFEKNIDEYEKYIHPDYYNDPNELFISDFWDLDFLRSMTKEKFVTYIRNASPWQTYKLIRYKTFSKQDEVVMFAYCMFTLHEYIHPDLNRMLQAYGPVPYNFALYFRFKDNKVITSCLLQDVYLFMKAIGTLTENPDDEAKMYLKKVLELGFQM
ncbi:MAG: hypothetical protein ACXAD7_02815 [Candidatus Kariarchaeaceae archaeon]|jgi:hypothetical protein